MDKIPTVIDSHYGSDDLVLFTMRTTLFIICLVLILILVIWYQVCISRNIAISLLSHIDEALYAIVDKEKRGGTPHKSSDVDIQRIVTAEVTKQLAAAKQQNNTNNT